MPWFLRGLRDGIVTTRYPRRRDDYADGFTGGVDVAHPDGAPRPEMASVCPTGAITVDGDAVRLDRGKCILCGACVAAYPRVFSWAAGSETAGLQRSALVVPDHPDENEANLAALRADLAKRVRALRRSVHIRHIDVGSDGAEEWEIHALTNPVYDVHRLGIFVTASPRHADILMVTGAGARGMIGPLRRTQAAMPNPVVVIAVGTDAISGGLLADTYATGSGAADELDVDVWVPGSPPSPFAILHGILLALGRVPDPATATGAAS
jgi:Ni,Fe-hydrogenase III small subunit/ferredoxin